MACLIATKRKLTADLLLQRNQAVTRERHNAQAINDDGRNVGIRHLYRAFQKQLPFSSFLGKN